MRRRCPADADISRYHCTLSPLLIILFYTGDFYTHFLLTSNWMSYSFLTPALVPEGFMERIFVFILYYRVLKILFPPVRCTYKIREDSFIRREQSMEFKICCLLSKPEQYITFSVLFVSIWRNRSDCIDLFTREEEEE